MQTICPHCQTVFKVSDEHLKIADGYVRCGICKEVFNALEDKEKSITKTELASTSETCLDKDILQNDTGSIETGSKQNIEQPVTKDQNTPLANKAPTDETVESPTANNITSDNIVQTDLFVAPSSIKITNSGLAPTTPETEKLKIAEPVITKTGPIVSETKTVFPEQIKSQNKTNNDIADTHPEQQSAVTAPATAPSKPSVENIAVTKNITDAANDNIDDNLFDGVQSKLIPDEYRIPELHNTYSIWHDIAWSLAILILTASLFAEYTWFNRNELIRKPQLRPLVTKFCVLANCDAMALREPGEIEMTTRNIYTHPNVKSALMISGTLVNHADFEQPYPNILIDFSDVRGEVIASRVFTPEDYLQIKTTSLRPLAPRIPINFNMEIQDPGKNASTYEFSFL
ncbi:MAG: DUF3426 domain-containing protein [Gammaproteobacteria bacterium]|nr:DUF3426 domain-containing protein [Gammaproteobacteria bacterium]